MFETLIESKRKTDKKRFLGVGFVSLTIHTALIATAIIATVKVGQSDTKVRTTPVIIVDWDQPEQQVKIEGIKDIGEVEICTIGCVFPRIDVPDTVLQEEFPYPRVYPRAGVGGGVANVVGPTGDVYAEALVEEKPSVLSAPQPLYPELLHQAGIEGRVLIQAIIDTSGRAEKNSVKIIESPDPAFDAGSRNWILHALFRPARVHGRAVRVLIQVPIDYRITGR